MSFTVCLYAGSKLAIVQLDVTRVSSLPQSGNGARGWETYVMARETIIKIFVLLMTNIPLPREAACVVVIVAIGVEHRGSRNYVWRCMYLS